MGQFLHSGLDWIVGYLQTAHILLGVQIFALRSGGLIKQSPLGLSMQKIFVLIVILAAISFSEYFNHLDPPYDERFDPSRFLTQLALEDRQIDIPEAGATVTERLNAFICRDAPVDLDASIYNQGIDEISDNGKTIKFLRQDIKFNSQKFLCVSAHLLKPLYDSQQIFKPSCVMWLSSHGGGEEMPLKLLKLGCAVLVVDQVGTGIRQTKAEFEKHPFGSETDALAKNLAYLNESIIALRVKDAQTAIDYLYTRDDLDTSDLTVAGFDAGGMTAFLTAAVDGRVRNTMVSGAFCDSPALPPGLSMAQIAQNIAPRNLWIEVGNKDETLPLSCVFTMAREVQRIYDDKSAETAFNFSTFVGGHQCNGGPFVDWLSTQLLRSGSQRQVQVAGKLKV